MPKININEVDIYYEIHGEGVPLVLMHHGMGSSKMWEPFLSGFTDIYKVIMYDRREILLLGQVKVFHLQEAP